MEKRHHFEEPEHKKEFRVPVSIFDAIRPAERKPDDEFSFPARNENPDNNEEKDPSRDRLPLHLIF